jgi:hypothetical protein
MLAKCPKCMGRGFIVSPNAMREETLCKMCDGQKEIDPKQQCKCGRPVIKFVGDIPMCGVEKCTSLQNNYFERATPIDSETTSEQAWAEYYNNRIN